jgi:hypothetical protein
VISKKLKRAFSNEAQNILSGTKDAKMNHRLLSKEIRDTHSKLKDRIEAKRTIQNKGQRVK